MGHLDQLLKLQGRPTPGEVRSLLQKGRSSSSKSNVDTSSSTGNACVAGMAYIRGGLSL